MTVTGVTAGSSVSSTAQRVRRGRLVRPHYRASTGRWILGMSKTRRAATGGLDPRQSFVSTAGVPNAPPENSYYVGGGLPPIPTGTFAPKGQVDPNYARGDDQISALALFSTGFRATNVAETYLTLQNASSNGAGSWSIQSDFAVSLNTALNFTFDYKNLLLSSVMGGRLGRRCQLSHQRITIVDGTAGGVTVYSNQPGRAQPQRELAEQRQQFEDNSGPFSGTGVVITTPVTFDSTHSYHITISGVEVVNATIASVPEPGSLAACWRSAASLLWGSPVAAGRMPRSRR